MSPARKTFLIGAGVGLLVGFAAGWMTFSVFLVYAQHVLRGRTEARIAALRTAHARPTPGGFLEPALTPPPTPQRFDFSVSVERPGGTVGSLQNLRGKVVVLNLWATWCAPCLAELPDFDALRARFKDDPRIAFVGVSKDTREDFQTYLDHSRYEMPLLRLADGASVAVAGDMVPITVVIDASASVVAVQRGAAKWNTDRTYRYLQTLLATGGRPVSRDER